MDYDRLCTAACKLDAMLRDPQFGLVTWHAAIKHLVEEMNEAYASTPPKPPAEAK